MSIHDATMQFLLRSRMFKCKRNILNTPKFKADMWLTFYILLQQKLNRYVFKVTYNIDLVENKRVIRPKFNRACCIQASFMLTLKNILMDPDI